MAYFGTGNPAALNGLSKARQASLLAAFDNKYAKRQSQIELEIRRWKIQSEQQKRKLTFFLVVLGMSVFFTWSFLGGTISPFYDEEKYEEKRSLQDLAESIRRVRLRRQQSLKENNDIPTGGIQPENVLVRQEDSNGWVQGNIIHPPHSQSDGADPPGSKSSNNEQAEMFDKNNLIAKLEDESNIRFDGEDQLEQIEERVRLSQRMRVKEELEAKSLEDKMAASLDALKQYAGNLPHLKHPEIEAESFS